MVVNKNFYELLQLNRYHHLSPVLTLPRCFCEKQNEEFWSFFFNSNRKFHSIKTSGEEGKRDDFWRKIGKSTIDLDVGYGIKSSNFFTWFPNLKKLRVPSIRYIHNMTLPETVEELYVESHTFGEELDGEQFKNLRFFGTKTLEKPKTVTSEVWDLIKGWGRTGVSSSLNLLEVKEIDYGHVREIETFLSLADTMDIHSKFPNLISIYSQTIAQNGCFLVHKLVKLDLIVNFRVIFLHNFQRGECCDECCDFLVKNCPNISFLGITDSCTHSFLKVIQLVAKNNKLRSLHYFSEFEVNITDLIFPTLDTLAVFGNINLEGLQLCTKIVKVRFGNFNLEILAKNFPNVKKARLVRKKFDENDAKVLGKYWKNLRILTVYENSSEARINLSTEKVLELIPSVV